MQPGGLRKTDTSKSLIYSGASRQVNWDPTHQPPQKNTQLEDTGMSLWGDACLPTFLALVVLQHLFDHGPGNPDVSRTTTNTVASPGLVWKSPAPPKNVGTPKAPKSWPGTWRNVCLMFVFKSMLHLLGASASFLRVISRGCLTEKWLDCRPTHTNIIVSSNGRVSRLLPSILWLQVAS